MAKLYIDTPFTFGEYPTSQKFTSFNARIKNSFELIAKTLSAIFQDYTVIDSSSRMLDKVFTYDSNVATYDDRTLPAASIQTPYIPLFTVVTNDALYFGFESIFEGLIFSFENFAGLTISPDWEYYNGTAFTDLSETDGTTGFTVDGIVSWTAPGDWETEDLNTILSATTIDSVDRFWVRVIVGADQDFKIKKVVRSTAVTSELQVVPTVTASMAVIIEPGFALINRKLASIESRTQLSVSAPGSNSRYTIIQLSDDGVLSIKEGTASATPIPPVASANNIKLADILISSTTTEITSSEITDQRVFSGYFETIVSDLIITLLNGADWIFNIEASDSFVIMRDPDDDIQTQWFGQDGHGELFPALSSVVAVDGVYYNISNSRIELADASDNTKPCEGIVVNKPTSTTGVVASDGICKGFSGLTPGSTYFLSTTAGEITTTAPSGSGNIIQRVGRAVTAEILWLHLGEPITIA